MDKPLTQLGPLGDNGARSGCRGPRGAGEARQLRACACAVSSGPVPVLFACHRAKSRPYINWVRPLKPTSNG